MPLTGTRTPKKASTPAQVAKKGRALLTEILDKLDTEWETLKQDSVEQHGLEEAGLLAHYHSNVRGLLQDIGGDPYTLTWPAEYAQASRLPGMCQWLRGLQDQEGESVKAAREKMVAALRASWPAYRDINPIEIPNGTSLRDHEVPPYTWDALVTNWPGETEEPHIQSLPHFSCRAVADFNLAALALLFLNRQCRYYLTDLHPHQTSDGRN